MRFTGFLLAAGFGCVPTAQSIEVSRQARSADVRAQAASEFNALNSSCKKELGEAFTDWKREAIFPLCNAQVPAGMRCGLIADKFLQEGEVKRHANTSCEVLTEDECWADYNKKYQIALQNRYGEHPPMETLCPNGCDVRLYELEVLRIFNAGVTDERDRAFEVIKKRCDTKASALQSKYDVMQANVDADAQAQEIDAENQRESLRRFGEAMQQMGQSMQHNHQGCCSVHGGVCGCSTGHLTCCDGYRSPSCGC